MPLQSKQEIVQGIYGLLVYLLIYAVLSTLFSAAITLIYQYGYISQNNFNFLGNVASLLPLSIAVIVYLMVYKGVSGSEIFKSLGLASKGVRYKLLLAVMLFVIVLLLEMVVNLAGYVTNTTINTNVSQVFSGAPTWFLVFIAVIEPINEELLFRSLLVPRLGIIPSAILFGLAHYSYMSTFGVEMIAAFVFGIIAGYIFKKTGSVYPSMLAHIAINTIAALSLI